MALTNIRNEPSRLELEVKQSTHTGRYMLNVPGPGEDMPMQDCPFIRLQKWGANYSPNLIHLENELRGQYNPMNRGELKYTYNRVAIKKPNFRNVNAKTEQSRAILPAWELLDKDVTRWDIPHENLQNHAYRRFANNISSRIEVMDKFLNN
tara:strand:+ start:235 stop:687 length:453 start_codon:yes stop_codon:yes gene_type:complete